LIGSNEGYYDSLQMLKKLSPALKLLISAALIYYIFSLIDIDQLKSNLHNISPTPLIWAVICIILANVTNGLRLIKYYQNYNLTLAKPYAIKTFLAGMVYNTVIPGSLGCDGYITYKLKKHYNQPITDSIKIAILSKLNGLFMLNIILCVCLYFSKFNHLIPYYQYVLPLFMILQFPIFRFIGNRYLDEAAKLSLTTMPYSFIIQIFILAAGYFCMVALGINAPLEYSAMLIISTIASYIPVTFMGLGTREAIFYKGNELLGISPELGVLFALVFFTIFMLASLAGLVFLWQKNLDTTHTK